jgi:ATP-dependent Clp endopeptidase proteolytic subunit ClpP
MTQANTWYSIRQKTPVAAAAAGVLSAAEIFIYGDIGESWWNESVSAAQFVKDIAAIDSAEITIRINSIGGSVPDGIAIYNAIKRHKAATTTVIDGLAASIASLIALAGDKVEMAENSTMMIHAPWTYAAGNSAELRDTADLLDTWAEAMATSYAAKTGKTTEEIMQLMTDGKDHWYTAAEAKDFGLVDTVITALPISASASGPQFDLSRFRNVPAALATASKPPQATQATPAAGAPNTATSTAPAPQGEGAQPVAAATTISEKPMPNSANPQAAHNPANTPDIAAIQAAAVAADAQRRSDIAAKFSAFGKNEAMAKLMVDCQNDTTITAAAAGEKLLAALAKDAQSVAGSIQTVADETDKRRDGVVAAMLLRAGVADKEAQANASANPYRGRTLLAIAEASLISAGVSTHGKNSREIVAAAFTQGTSDFPILLENIMHKTLLASYATQSLTWSRFCKRGTVSDFRAHNRYRVGSLGNLQPKNELGEYKNVAIPDGEKSSISAATKGFILNISREAIINDDLGALTDQSTAAGRAAARTVEVDVYTLLNSNNGMGPVMSDGKTLFHADHHNIATGGAISVDVLDAMRVLMAQQKDVTGNDFLDLRPGVLLVPIGMGGSARVIIGAEYDTSVSGKFQVPNRVRGLVSDIVDTPRMSGTRFHLLANPMEAAAIEVAFLDGQSEPYLETAQAFDTDGGRLKVRMDYGVAGHDYRGAVTNAGA